MSVTHHDVGAACACVTRHRPEPRELDHHHVWPVGWGGPEDGLKVWLCPTSHRNTHELLAAWRRYGGEPPWEPDGAFVGRKRFGPLVQMLAEEGYRQWASTR